MSADALARAREIAARLSGEELTQIIHGIDLMHVISTQEI
jgi:hypothetical protein